MNLGWDAFEGSRYRGGPEPADHVLPLLDGELYVMSLTGGLYRLQPGEPPADR